jgi:murein DD-endopeptidase MepM/ murein hydrolase activator NlpD
MAHLQSGSVAVAEGDNIQSGDRIGAVGNSGNTAEPHLHIHAQRAGTADAPLSGEPLPIRIDGRFLVRNDRLTAN